MDLIAAYRDVGSHRGAAAICGTTHKTVKRIVEAHEASSAQALSGSHSVPLGAPDPVTEPAMLRRRDGTPVYQVAGCQTYTSRAVVDAEQRILTAARTSGGCALSAVRVGIALGAPLPRGANSV
jgi:hypothetical protein